MKKHHFFIITSFALILFALILFALILPRFSGTPIEKYVPKNTDDRDIISLIMRFHNAKNAFDLNNYLSCLDESGQYMFSGHLMVSKSELTKLLPAFWSDLQSGNAQIMPICRENLNGNFFDGEVYDPVIAVSNYKAKVSVTFQTSIVQWRTVLFIDLVRKNGAWLINRFEWDMG